MKNLQFLLLMAALSGCIPAGELKVSLPKKVEVKSVPATLSLNPNTFTFDTAGDYTASNSLIAVDDANNNLVKLLALDQIDHLTTGASGDLGFQSGGLTGTEGITFNAGNKITLDGAGKNFSELDKFWTPEYARLISYWKLNGTAGAISSGATIANATGGAAGTVTGSGLSYVNGKINQGLSGITTNDFVDVGNVAALSSMAEVTISAWIYTTDITSTQTIAGKELGFKLELRDNGPGDLGVPVFYIGDGSTWNCTVKFSNIMQVNKWYYITGTYNGAEVSIYVNGVQGETCPLTGNAVSTSKMYIGGWDQGTAVAAEPFKGIIDEVQIWDKGLTGDQVREISYKQQMKSSGTFYSRIMEGPNVVSDWTNFGFKIPYPLRPLSTTADPAAYSSQTTDFTTSLVGLWHLNEAGYNSTGGEVIDSSGNGLHGAKSSYGGAITNVKGIFGKAYNGNWTDYLEIPDNNLLDGVSKISFSIWGFRGDNLDTFTSPDGGALFAKRDGYGNQHSYTAFIEDSMTNGGDIPRNGKLCVDIADADDRFCSVGNIPYMEWFHVAVTYDGTVADANQRVKIYINGVLDTTGYESATSIPNNTSNLRIGALNDNYFQWNGMLDEFAIWNRTLTDAQVAELYRRGAHNVSMQVRTCSAADCSDRTNNSGWVGPDGTENTFFSELTNPVSTSTPYFDFSIMAPMSSWLAVENKKYFQYRTILETKSAAYLPEVSEVAVGPAHYSASKPYVTTTVSGALPFSTLTSFVQTLGGALCSGGVTYQISTGVSGWKYWNGSTWTTATTESDANTAAVVNTNIAAFATQFGVVNSNSSLNIKTILNSNGTTPCELDTVTVGGLKY